MKHEVEASAKFLRIQNIPQNKDEVICTLLTDFFFAPILKATPQEMALDFDHAYRQHTAYTRQNKLPWRS